MSAERKQKIREMKEICSPKSREALAPAVSRFVYLKIGFLFTRLLVKTRVTPNQITWFWGLLMMFLILAIWLSMKHKKKYYDYSTNMGC